MSRFPVSMLIVAVALLVANLTMAEAAGAFERASGVLLHPTALPGRYGIGDLGPESYRFVEFLDVSRQKYWQVLPLGPVDRGGGPYGTYSAFAGNPILVSPELLREDGLLAASDLENVPEFPRGRVDFPAVFDFKERLFRLAWDRFRQDPARMTALREFADRESAWLGDYSLFRAALDHFKNRAWNQWEPGLKNRDPESLKIWRVKLADAIAYQDFVQFLFFEQWRRLKADANRRGIEIIGDIPIYVAYNSSDVWANQRLFQLDAAGNPRFVAGAPPDDFSKEGQRWGMPVYDWKAHEREGFAWWLARFQKALEMSDVLRIDHFRGFEAYWEIEASEPTAKDGRWVKAPGEALFNQLKRRFPRMPFIVEDLGVITPEVDQLRDQFSMPGIRTLQYGLFGGKDHPDNYPTNCVVYLDTHDNDTIMGWFQTLDEGRRKELLDRYKFDSPEGLQWPIIQIAMESRANLSIVMVQDILGLGAEARFNTPGTIKGNWVWRCPDGALTDEIARRLAKLTENSHRERANSNRATSSRPPGRRPRPRPPGRRTAGTSPRSPRRTA